MTDKKISFCTACKGRLHHLKETLPVNLANQADYPNAEFVILAYGDREVYDWVKETYPDEIKSGRIKLAFTEAETFKHSHVWNVANRVATGDILLTYGADNFIPKGTAEWFDEQFGRDEDILIRTHPRDNLLRRMKGIDFSGTQGRIAISKENFYKLHGYDEVNRNHYGSEDQDFRDRAVASGMKHVHLPDKYLGHAIQHTWDERTTNLSDEGKKAAEVEKSERNSRLYKAKRIAIKMTVGTEYNAKGTNPDGNFGVADVTILNPDFTETIHHLGPKPHPEWQAEYKGKHKRNANRIAENAQNEAKILSSDLPDR